MTKNEFIIKLQEALENDLDAAAVRENVNYYSSYIDDEMRKGRRMRTFLLRSRHREK